MKKLLPLFLTVLISITLASARHTPSTQYIDGSGNRSPFEGNQKGKGIGLMTGTTYCSEKDGSLDKEGFTSCAGGKPYTASCGSNCKYVKGSCGTPQYYYAGSVNNALKDKNKEICEVALSRANLRKLYGKGKKYCNKKVTICYKNTCRLFPITSTGLKSNKKIDMTGCVFKELGIPGRTVSGLKVYKS